MALLNSMAASVPDMPVGDQPLLARLMLKPNGLIPGMGSMHIEIENDVIMRSGRCTWARVLNGRRAVYDCDVGEYGSGAEFQLNTVELRIGGPLVLERGLRFLPKKS